MTDPSDRRERRNTEGNYGEAEASVPTTGSKNSTPTRPDDEDNTEYTSSPLTIEERQQLGVGHSQTNDKIEEPKRPTVAVTQVSPSTTSKTKIAIARDSETVEVPVNPTPEISAHETQINSNQIGVVRIHDQLIEQSRPQITNKISRGTQQPLNRHTLSITRVTDQIDTKARPSTQVLLQPNGQQALLDEIEDIDPIFGWGGGHPYGSDRPTLILHREEDDSQIQSFAFLQRALRDTFTEIKGGEPTVDQVEFVANEAQIPTIGGRIVTLDLTTDEWTPSIKNGRPTIERGGIDIVSALTEQGKTLYSGGLGYLVVNVPSDWEATYRRQNFFQKLVGKLADSTPHTDSEDGGAFEKLGSAPIILAQPRVTESEAFEARVVQYFAFRRKPDYETIAQLDASFIATLRSQRWAKVALSERQSYGEESSRHYNWKALIVEGLAYALWKTTADSDQPFDTFVQEKLIPEGPLYTEYPVGSDHPEEDGLIADVYHTDDDEKWLPDQLTTFLDEELYERPLAIEFETGFAEAGFGYRKLVETIEKYRDSEFSGTLIVVVPPRLLYRGERQARHLDRLVRYQGDQLDNITTKLCIPTVSDGRCTGLQTASTRITRLYDEV